MLSWSTNLGNKLFGPDPKLEFRERGKGVDLLAGPAIPIEDPYWRQYLTLPTSASDLPLLLPTAPLLQALHSNPSNLLTLVRFLSSVLFTALSTPGFPRRAHIDQETDVLNAVRGLSRVVPLLMAPQGVDGEGRRLRDEIEEELFWKRERVIKVGEIGEEALRKEEEAAETKEGDGQFVLEDDEDDEDDAESKPSDPLTSAAPAAAPAPDAQKLNEDELLPPLAERLISALVDLLFVPGFTVAESLRPGEDVTVSYSIWEPGIASPAPSTPTSPLPTSHLSNRLELLRLLTLLISLPSLLTPPGLFPALPNRFRDALVTARAIRGGDKNVVLCLLCSVVNTAFAAPSSSSTGAGAVSGEGLRERAARIAAETARRGAAVSAGASGGEGDHPRPALVGACVQFLAAVLAEHAPAEAEPSSAAAPSVGGADPSPFVPQEPTMGSAKPTSSAAGAGENLFAYYLSRLHRPADLFILQRGVASLLTQTLTPASASLFPLPISLPLGAGAAQPKSPGLANEALVVLWRLLETNRKFAAWVVRPEIEAEGGRKGRSRLVETVVAVQAVMGEMRGDETQLGLLRLASFLSQTLTALSAESALSSSDASNALANVLSAPITPQLVGEALYGVVRRQCEAQGVEWGVEEGQGVSAVDFVVITLHSLILPSSTAPSPTSHPSRAGLATLYPSLLLSLTNLSPFIRNLGAGSDAATRLTRIWLAFSAPSWVLMEEGNPRLLYYLLETFNNIIHHNLASNPHLLYALLQTRRRFSLLSSFTLAEGIAEARRLRAARRARQASSPGSLGAIPEGQAAPLSPTLSAAGASEKALGKRRERNLSVSSLADLSLGGSPAGSPGLADGAGARSPSEDGAGGRESLDLSAEPGEERPFVGKNGFVPTEEWVASWQSGLPLDTLLILLSHLATSLLSNSATRLSHSSLHDSDLSLLQADLVSPSVTALIPSPPPVAPRARRFAPSSGSTTWLSSLVYGRIYLAQLQYLRDTLPVQLFAVAQASGARVGRAGAAAGGAAGLVGELSAGLGAELERAGRSAVEVGGRVGGLARGLLGGLGGANGRGR
ncbi:hypothetical protein JCM10207_002979 [Rhodosporidiobolus poonsookiae]